MVISLAGCAQMGGRAGAQGIQTPINAPRNLPLFTNLKLTTMARIEKKLTSMRLDSDVLDAIDAFCDKNRYWKRSTVINSILAAVTKNFSTEDIYNMVREWNWSNHVVDAKFEITEELKPREKR